MALNAWRNHLIEDVEVDLLLAALKERYGYDFTGYARASLKRRLRELAAYFEVKHLSELLPALLYDERVARATVNRIVVAASEFFRDPPVWQCFRDTVLPMLDSYPRINIWQAGCGRGEETYTLSILLREAGLAKKIRLVATDIDSELLEEARRGRWPRRNFEQWRRNYESAGGLGDFHDYFVTTDDEIAIRDELKNSVEFLQHNLVTDSDFLEVQLIVCRNVMIYFGEPLQSRVFDLFMRSLQRGGYLLLGVAERVTAVAGLVEQEGDCHIFRKTMEGGYV